MLIWLTLAVVLGVRQKFDSDNQILHNDPAFDELESIAEHPLGTKILQTVALQLASSDGIQSITTLLTNLKSDLEGKQIQQDGQNAAIQSQCKTDMDSYGQRIQLAVNEINDCEFKIGRMEGDIEDLQGELELKQSYIDILQNSENSLRELRLKQSANYNKRTSQLKEMIQAFQVMLPKMMEFYDESKAGQEGESFIQEEAFADSFVRLAKCGPDNPIVALVQMSRMMDPTSLQTIIEKMEMVRDSLVGSVDEETILEEQNIRDNDVLMNEIFNDIQAIQREKAADEQSLAETIMNRDAQQKRGSDAQAEFQASKAGMKQRRNQCQELLVQYQQNTIERSREIEIIKKVQIIISTKLNIVKAFIQDYQLN